MILYNWGIGLMNAGIHIASLWSAKLRKWVSGRRNLIGRMESAIGKDDRICWVHAASLGEFEQGRPVIEAIRAAHPEYRILLTFFSPSGYEVRKNYPGADYIFYLPVDTRRQMREFVRVAHPEIAVIVKYEFWLNCIDALSKSGCRLYVISSIFRRSSVFFRWYGGIFRKRLTRFTRIFVQDENSERLLNEIGLENVTLAGDTRFDRVAAEHSKTVDIPEIEKFASGHRTFIAGSTWEPDERIILPLVDSHPDMRFIIAPHEISQERIGAIERRFPGKVVRYSEIRGKSDFDLNSKTVLVIDTIGFLASAYRYADFAYIGGGFGAGIHNTLEAATFGMPVAFGPKYVRFKEAVDMVSLGIATSVRTRKDLAAWLDSLLAAPDTLARISSDAAEFVHGRIGATQKVMAAVFPEDAR